MEYYLLFLVMSFILFGVLLSYFKIAPETIRKNRYINSTIAKPQWFVLLGICALSLVLSSIVITFGMFGETADTEILNGKVVSKLKDKVSCSHSYDCNCKNVQSCSGSGTSRSCSTSRVCDTCYEHSNDYDWVAKTTIGNFEIDRIDRQGSKEPPRWSVIQMGEPVSRTHTFTNYIKAAKSNVLNRQGTKISYAMPTYPDKVYDYYKIDRAVSADNAVQLPAWSAAISKVLTDLGPSKEVNLVMVFTKAPEIFAEQLNAAWGAGKKNDVIVVVGVTDKPEWIKVLSWTKREDFKIELRDALLETAFTPDAYMQVIATYINKKFDRRHGSEFEYLKYDIEPPQWSFYVAMVLFFVPLIGFILIRRSK